MKKIIITILSIFLSQSLSAQSILIGEGASINIGEGADICAGEYGNITGNLTGGGTECGVPINASTFSLSVSVADGWNMISVPGININGMGVTNWWSGLIGTVYKFVPGSGYSGITTTTLGEGYWMKHAGARTYNTGDEWPASGIIIVPHDPLTATSGWNIIGGYEDAVAVGSLTTTPAGQLILPIYKYVSGSGYSSATTIDPGYGYWVKVATTCQINIPDTLTIIDGEIADWFKEDWGRIVIKDAGGSYYTLYAVNGEVDLSRYELPPAPPAEMFDIRFSSGRIAEDLNNLVRTIEMRGIVHPVTVKVLNMDIRIRDETGMQINENVKAGEEIVISNALINKLMVSGELLPTFYALEQNYPNPFNPNTVIEFSLPEDESNVMLSIYNALGEKVAELVNSSLTAGRYQFQWNAKNVATGMFIYELKIDNFVSVKKMILIK